MQIAAGKIVLDFYNNDSVPLKRKQLEELCDSIRKQFNISILEIADFDDAERCVIGFSAVIPENWKTTAAQTFLEKICNTIDTTAFARVVSEDTDLLSHGD